MDTQLIRPNGRTPVTISHPFTIHSDGSVSYGNDTMTAEQVETTILDYRRKKAHLRVVIQNLGCRRFPIEQIEAFIAEYEARPASVANTMVKPGDRVRINDEEYIVATLTRNSAALVSLRDGNRWDNPITVENVNEPIWLSDFSDDNFKDETIEVL